MIGYDRIKRVGDIFLAGLILFCCLPLMLLIAAVITMDGGPSLFVHQRVGRHGRNFGCWKFRSMRVNSDQVLNDLLRGDPAAAQEWAAHGKLKRDPRITTFGRFLRKTSLDELPQLWNVLVGEMSMVGPRPVTQQELDTYYHFYADCYTSVRPGITGLWQVSGRSNMGYHDRVKMDVTYVQEIGWRLDTEILWRTPLAVLAQRGAV